jgi:hypothetical protein
MGKSIISPERLMTDKEMKVWFEQLKRMPTQSKQVYFSKVSQGFSFDYGQFLIDDWTNNKGETTGEPNIIIPLHLKADGKSAWITATLTFIGGNIEAVHLNHGYKHLPQMMRSVEPGQLF